MAIHLTRTFDAPPAAIWGAWTDRLAEWFGAPGTEATATQDPVPGGRWELEMQAPDGNTYGFSGTYEEVVEPTRLVFTMIASGQDGAETCTVVLTSHGTGTEQDFRQEGDNLTHEQYEQATAGWSVFFERLDALTQA